MSVQNYIASLDSPQREIMTILRSWILDLGRHTEEKISHSVPYFYFFGPLCYLSPGKEGVDLCFVKGYVLDDENKILESKDRKESRSRTFYSVAELEEFEDQIRPLLNEAAIQNEYQFKRKQKKTK